jgi:prepilin-type N-terminal cleavage/methylation domain-containing protein
MPRANQRPGRRPGYTLIELMIVIAIIAILVALLTSAVSATRRAQKRTQTLHEIGKLDSSLKAAFSRYGSANSMPGKLVLINRIDVYRNPSAYVQGGALANLENPPIPNTPQMIADIMLTKDVLTKMFGSKLFSNTRPANQGGGRNQIVYWDGSRIIVNGAYQGGRPRRWQVLEGQQCLVFYLGGIIDSTNPTLPKPQGFVVNVLDPSDFLNTPDHIGPFYQFDGPRLLSAGNGFYSYLDPYGDLSDPQSKPYAYFGQPPGGTNVYVNPAANSFQTNLTSLVSFSNGLNLGPYSLNPSGSSPNFAKPNSFQIISAGRDKKFGSPSVWFADRGTSDYYGRDDMGNFSTGSLAEGTN